MADESEHGDQENAEVGIEVGHEQELSESEEDLPSQPLDDLKALNGLKAHLDGGHDMWARVEQYLIELGDDAGPDLKNLLAVVQHTAFPDQRVETITNVQTNMGALGWSVEGQLLYQLQSPAQQSTSEDPDHAAYQRESHEAQETMKTPEQHIPSEGFTGGDEGEEVFPELDGIEMVLFNPAAGKM